MKPSSLSLRDLTFLSVCVDIDTTYRGSASDFDFNGAFLHWGLRHGKHEDNGGNWWVGVDFAIDSNEEKRCPYVIQIKAVGLFAVTEGVPEERREKFVFESGASLVYGAIREMVSTITARSAFGALMLPTASFFDTFEEHQKKMREKQETKPKLRRTRKKAGENKSET